MKEAIENVKEENKNKINKVYSFLMELINDQKEKNLSYLNNFRKHCPKTEELPYHLCDDGKVGKFIKLEYETNNNEKDIYYVVCENCRFCYLSNCIKMYCKNCKKNYYSSILKDSENINCLPATWDSYHCGTRKKEIMKCLKCKDILYLDLFSNRLVCLNKICNFSSRPEHIIWGCHLCGAEFKSGAKIYNPLDFIILRKVINKALLYKIKAIPPYLPCCQKKINDKTIFYHKQNCKGILYEYNLDGRDLVVCEKCQALNKFNYFSWLCPLCSKNFTLNHEFKPILKKHNYLNSVPNIHIEYDQKLDLKSSNQNNINNVSSLDTNIFGFGFYARESQAIEYAKSKSKNKYNKKGSFDRRSRSQFEMKNLGNNEESTDKNSKSIDKNNHFSSFSSLFYQLKEKFFFLVLNLIFVFLLLHFL